MVMRTHKAKNVGKIQFYKDRIGDWRWRVISRNGRILSVSSEGYNRLADAKRGVTSTMRIINRIVWNQCDVE